MNDLTGSAPAYALHAAVMHLDRAAHDILQERLDLTYARFLLLLTVDRLGPTTQRALADELATHEPGVSRAVAAAAADGQLEVARIAGTGNRREVTLTAAGRELFETALALLEAAFAEVLAAAGLTRDDVLSLAGRILGVVAPGSSAAVPPVSS